MTITSGRDIFVGAHLTADQKEGLRSEAERRCISMSALIAQLIEDFLVAAPDEQLDPIRSNKRVNKEEDVPLPLEP